MSRETDGVLLVLAPGGVVKGWNVGGTRRFIGHSQSGQIGRSASS